MTQHRKGKLEFRNGRWWARVWVPEHTATGPELVRKRFDLETDNKAAARRAMAQLVAKLEAGESLTSAAPQALSRETVNSYAETWLESRKARGVSSAAYEATLYKRVWSPVLGSLELGAKGVTALVRETLEQAAAGKLKPPKRKNRKAEPRPYSRQSIVHMRAVVFRLFDAADHPLR